MVHLNPKSGNSAVSTLRRLEFQPNKFICFRCEFNRLIIFPVMTLGFGRHLWDIPATQTVEFGEVFQYPFSKTARSRFFTDV